MLVSVDVDFVDKNHLIAMRTGVDEANAVDDLDNHYQLINAFASPFYKMLFLMKTVNPECSSNERIEKDCEPVIDLLSPMTTSLAFDVDPNHGYPTLLKTLSWRYHLLMATYYSQVDMPFVAGDQWYELACGMKLRIDQADASAGRFTFNVTITSTNSQTPITATILTRDIPSILIDRFQFFDKNGQEIEPIAMGMSVSSQGGSSSSSGSSGTLTGESGGNASGSGSGTISGGSGSEGGLQVARLAVLVRVELSM